MPEPLTLPEILKQTLDAVLAATGTQAGEVFLLDDSTGDLVLADHRGACPDGFREITRFRLGEGFPSRVALSGEPLITTDLPRDVRFLRKGVIEAGFGSLACVPLRVRGRLVGTMEVAALGHRPWTDTEIRLLSTIGDQIGVAVENTRLHETLQEAERRRAAELEAVMTVSREVVGERPLAALGQEIVTRAIALTQAHSGTLYLWNEAEAALRPFSRLNLGDFMREVRYPLGHGITGAAAEASRGLISNAYPADPRHDNQLLQRIPLAACMAAPLKSRDRLLGVLTLNHTEPGRRFTAEDLTLLETFASQMAAALDNAQLFAELDDSYRRLQEAQEALVRAETLRALGQMAAGMAHDFNNALAVILGQAELLRLRVTDAEAQHGLAVLTTAAQGGAATIRRLQEFTRRRPSAAYRPVDLGQVVREVVELTRPRWRNEAERRGAPVALQLDLSPIPPIRGLAAELRDALTNLLFNALDAMPQGGTLTITARRIADRRSQIADLAGRDSAAQSKIENLKSEIGDFVEIAVSDTGIGMSEEVKTRVFDPFFTTKGVKGSGLGLSMVYGIIERHGGQIRVESQPGRGTTVRLTFPVDAGEVEVPVIPPVPQSAPRRILLVDDEAEVRQTLAALLQAAGHQVVVAASGAEALACVAPGRFDLVLTDLGMPGLSGWQVAAAVKAQVPPLPVVLLTGWGEQSAPEDPQGGGQVDRILAKPCPLEDLLGAIAELTGPLRT